MSIESMLKAVKESGKDLDETEIPVDENYKEIFRLEQMLLEHNITYGLRRIFDGWQIVYPDFFDCVCSVIQHFGSYGSQDDLLEIMGLTDDGVEGYLQAEDVLNRIFEHYNSCVLKR